MHKMSKVLLRMLVSYIIQSQICSEKKACKKKKEKKN